MKGLYIALVASFLMLAGLSHAATVVISQPTYTTLADYGVFGQSFTANGDYSVTSINLYISSSFGGSNITLEVFSFDSLSSALGKRPLGTGLLSETSLTSTAAWVNILLAAPVDLVSGSEYAFKVIPKDPGGSATGWNNYGVNSAGIYSGGDLLNFGSGGTVSRRVSDISFQIEAVPEPTAPIIVALALVAKAISRTRRHS